MSVSNILSLLVFAVLLLVFIVTGAYALEPDGTLESSGGEPASIEVIIEPSDPSIPSILSADGMSSFDITYRLCDEAGNPSADRTLCITSNETPGKRSLRRSDSLGEVRITYGPNLPGIYKLTAYAEDNASVSAETLLEFAGTGNEVIRLAADRLVLGGREPGTVRKSAITAVITDWSGYPVAGATVNFTIIPGHYPDSQISGPYLSSPSAVSDEEGKATVFFFPGEYTGGENSSGYQASSCLVRALWNTTSGDIGLEWRNYPYLSVTAEAEPSMIKVNDTVKIVLTFTGDGWAFEPGPSDVVAVVDRSGSMLNGYPDRMVALGDALRLFAEETSDEPVRLGLVSFGIKGAADISSYANAFRAGKDESFSDNASYIAENYPENGKVYDDYATVDIPPSDDRNAFMTAVSGIIPGGRTPLREALYLAIMKLSESASSDTSKVLVVVCDGDYDYYGDPLARGTGRVYYGWRSMQTDYYIFPDLPSGEQDMSAFAAKNNVRIFTVTLSGDMTEEGEDVLESLASETGGKHYHADEGEDLLRIFEEITGEIREPSYVSAAVDIPFDEILVDGLSVDNSGEDTVIEYVYEPSVSTVVEKKDGEGIITVTGEDQSGWWNANRSLHFDMGEMGPGYTYKATFLLRVLSPGNISLFGGDPVMTIDGAAGELLLPETVISVIADQNSTGTNAINVSGLHSTGRVEGGGAVGLEWMLGYTGEGSVSQRLYYLRTGDDAWIPFTETSGIKGPVREAVQHSYFVTAGLPYGEYRIRVLAFAPDADEETATLKEALSIGTPAANYIRIE